MTPSTTLESPAPPPVATGAPPGVGAGTRARSGLLRWSGPIWPIAVIVSMLTIEIRFLAHSSWRPVVLYDGDSLTFPILWKALLHGGPLHPVMSSQLLVFPEGVIYAVARLCTTSVSASIVAVAYLNVVLFYLGLRALAEVVIDGPASRRRLAAVIPTLLLIAAMLLERVMGVDATTIATPLLFDCFYVGVILVGIATLCFAAHQLRWRTGLSLRRRVATTAAAAGVTALTIISDPLFVIQVTAPFLLVIAGLWALRRLHWRQVAWLAGPQLGALVLYKVLSPLYKPYLGEGATGYIHFKGSGAAYRAFDDDLHLILRSTTGCWEVALVTAAWLAGLATTAILLHRSSGPPGAEATGRLLVSAFAVVASVSIIAVVIVVGEGEARYLLPVVTFPFVALVPAADTLPLRLPAPARILPATILGAVTVLGITALPGAASILRPEPTAVQLRYGTPLGESCLEAAFDHRPVNGVAAYWTARALDLYNPDDERVLQVKLNETIFPWLVNLGSYEGRHFTFVLIDTFNHAKWTMRPHDVRRLGRPARIITCPGFKIYTYPPGTVGYNRLNAIVDRSLRTDLERYA
jgi:hypothetical protein